MIAFRKKHSAIRGECSSSGLGLTVSVHTNQPWDNNVTQESKFLGVMFAGAVRPEAVRKQDEIRKTRGVRKQAERRRESVWSLEMERTRELETEDLVYLAVNVFWEDQQFFCRSFKRLCMEACGQYGPAGNARKGVTDDCH